MPETRRPIKPWKPAVLAASRALGRGSAPLRVVPDFLIIGGQRCGTTSLYRTLSQHPAIMKPVRHKGVHYFDVAYEHPMSWYRGHFPLSASARRIERDLGLRPQSFESSPYYMFHPQAAQRIARDLPGVRLVALIRDPVERAYSAHAHEYARGFETEPIRRALELEQERLSRELEKMAANPTYESHAHRHQAYVSRGEYVTHLERVSRLVGRENLHIVDSGDFFSDPAPTYQLILKFLGLPALGEPRFERHNSRPRADMDPEVRAQLESYFEPWDERLSKWLGWTPSWRR